MNNFSKTDTHAFMYANATICGLQLGRVSILYLGRLNVCDRIEEKNLLLTCAQIVKPYYEDRLCLRDIYLGVVYLYYSLNVIEQCEDWLKSTLIKKYTKNYDMVMQMITEISCLDIIYDKENMSSKIRRMLMGLDDAYKFDFHL